MSTPLAASSPLAAAVAFTAIVIDIGAAARAETSTGPPAILWRTTSRWMAAAKAVVLVVEFTYIVPPWSAVVIGGASVAMVLSLSPGQVAAEPLGPEVEGAGDVPKASM